MSRVEEIEAQFNGLILKIDVTSYRLARPAPYAPTPDHAGYDDEGDCGDLEFTVKGIEIDCPETAAEYLGLDMDNDDLCTALLEALENG